MLIRHDYVRSFKGYDEQGNPETLRVVVAILAVPRVPGVTIPETRGAESVVASDGRHLNTLEKGVYEDPATNQIFRSDAPDAFEYRTP